MGDPFCEDSTTVRVTASDVRRIWCRGGRAAEPHYLHQLHVIGELVPRHSSSLNLTFSYYIGPRYVLDVSGCSSGDLTILNIYAGHTLFRRLRDRIPEEYT
jgi:hypothetical protein